MRYRGLQAYCILVFSLFFFHAASPQTCHLCYLSLQNEARKLNHQEVVEEDKRLKLPSNWEAKKARLEWELAEDDKKKVFQFFSSPGLVHWMYWYTGPNFRLIKYHHTEEHAKSPPGLLKWFLGIHDSCINCILVNLISSLVQLPQSLKWITSRHCQKILFLFYVAQHNVLSHHPKILWQFYAGFTRIKISKSFAVVQLNFSQFELIIKYRLLIQECAARGEDYNRVKLLDITADDAERWERKKKKKNPDTGFAGRLFH